MTTTTAVGTGPSTNRGSTGQRFDHLFDQYAPLVHAVGGGDVMADFQGLAQIPQMLGNVRTGVLALRSLTTAPQAAMASGNPAVGGAIVGLGAQLLVFLYQTVQAIGDDIDAITQVADNYRQQEERVVAGTHAALADLDRSAVALAPSLSYGSGSSAGRASSYAAR